MNTLRLIVFLVLAVLIAELTDWYVIDQLMIAAGALFVLTYLWSRFSLRGLTISRGIATDRAQVGQTIRERIVIQNRSLLAKLWIEVLDFSTLPNHQASRVIHARGRSQNEWYIDTVCVRRGRYRLGPFRLQSADPFGLYPTELRVPTVVDIVVYPAIVDLREFVFPAGQLTNSTRSRRQNPYASSSIAGVRDYAPGDPYNRISWSSTARTSRLMVKEFDDEPISDVWIVLDLDQQQSVLMDELPAVGRGQTGRQLSIETWLDATEEYAITIAASLARRSLDEGRSVGLIASAAHYTVLPCDRSDRQYWKFLELLAIAEADGHTPLAEVLVAEARRFTRQSVLLVITSSTDETWIGALTAMMDRRVSVAVIYIEPETFGPSQSSHSTMSRLLATGIPTYLVKQGDSIGQTLVGGGTMVATDIGDRRG